MTDGYTPDSKPRSLTSLIAWFSVCLLAAGWGSKLGPMVQQTWTIAGLFGLAPALGLGVVHRARLARHRQKQRHVTQRRIEQTFGRLARHVAKNATIEDVNVALSRIAKDDQERSAASLERRSERRLPFERSVRVQPLQTIESTPGDNCDAAFTAYVRDISASGVGLLHDRRIDCRRVVLIFDLSDGESISLLAHLDWQNGQPDGNFISGAKLIDVMAPVNSGTPAGTSHEPLGQAEADHDDGRLEQTTPDGQTVAEPV